MTATADLAIRLARATFNRALAEADLDAIAPLLARDAILVTGSDSAVIAGRKAQLLAWKREFASADRLIYSRTPGNITVSPVEPIAMEQGHWQGVAADTGRTLASGSYAAKWRKAGDAWVIEAEIYLTLT
ncbi:nuclear transport factor 2 family protein [Sphingobium sp. BYY-5]|uniref:nuclear transport factor 2 family protein n=1 Tax=Sphingobium sp. BYY-5 TaxID=2926400 RepID=UPI001FA7B6C8|nr:nuclear transport factor 2 family protein [Sphingobium sp. BYY-5]MCI4590484.1 nuclear transport factor 2 family protein [Sphingobium sp. BYY-5]